MKKQVRDTAWQVANGMLTKSAAARKLKVHRQSVDRYLYNGLVAVLKERNIIKYD